MVFLRNFEVSIEFATKIGCIGRRPTSETFVVHDLV